MATDPTDPRRIQGQTKIVEGAGLEESRLNQEFIDWLRTWGSPLLLVLCVVAGGWAAYQWWERQQAKVLNDAYVQLASAQESGSPDGLLRVAREHGKSGAVGVLATLRAADIYYESALKRLAPGGTVGKAEDQLNDEQRAANLEQARALYAQAAALAAADADHAVHEIAAHFGVAAVAETVGKTADALKAYDAAAAVAKRADLPALAAIADKHKADSASLASLPPLRPGTEIEASRRPQPKQPEPAQTPVGVLAPEAGPPVPAAVPDAAQPQAPVPSDKPTDQPAAPPQN